MRDFTRDGGGSIRMYGILNALAEKGHKVVFISNASQKNIFHSSIKHIPVGYKVTHRQKSILQMLLAFLPVSLIGLIYKPLFETISKIIRENIEKDEIIYSFEYLDNSLVYVLKKKGIIKDYINDIHGIVPIEFDIQSKAANNLKTRLLYYFKYLSAKRLDYKVFNNGYGFIYVSNKMKDYYEKEIIVNPLRHKSYIIPNLLSIKSMPELDLDFQKKLINRLCIQSDNFVFLFVGRYKSTAGVEDLINAFKRLYVDKTNIKLILTGKGKTRNECELLSVGLDNIFFIDSIPYDKLFTLQSTANVIVCPDRMNDYSNSIVHLKYFDALASGKLVINGAFDSVKEINKDNFLSLTFEPSNVESLYNTMKECIDNYATLTIKYKNTAKYTFEHLTYDTCIDILLEKTDKI
jgi:glycosyltransferase involved in cell wall biosynthesis